MKQKWSDLNPTVRKLLVIGGTIDAVGRAAALIDVSRRSSEQVRGNRTVWKVALGLVNSAGILPMVYFLRGRR